MIKLNNLAGLIALSLGAFAQAAQLSRPVLLAGADFYPESHGVIEHGELLISAGKIVALGARVDAPADAQRIDVAGKRIYPGLISPLSTLGLVEFGILPATQDFAEAGENNANLHVEIAVNADTQHWPVARAAGVLGALIVPQIGEEGLIAGQSALMKPQGWTYEQMTVASGVAMHLYWPSKPAMRQRLGELMERARLYQTAARAGSLEVPDLRLAALIPVLEGRMPVMIHVTGMAATRNALAFADAEKLRVVLVSDSSVWRLAGELVVRKIPLILTAGTPRSWEGFEDIYSAAGKLVKAGVTVAIASGGGNAKQATRLPMLAATYAAYGMGDEAALRAITLTPAEICGVADRLGSLDSGKAATLIVTSGDVFLPTSRVRLAWIDGKSVDLDDNHHERLYRKFQRKYQELSDAR